MVSYRMHNLGVFLLVYNRASRGVFFGNIFKSSFRTAVLDFSCIFYVSYLFYFRAFLGHFEGSFRATIGPYNDICMGPF